MAGNTVSVVFQIDQDQQGRTTLKQIDKGIDDIGKTSKKTGSDVDTFLKAFKVALVLDFFKTIGQAAFDFGVTAVKAFNEAKSAALGLDAIAKFKGIDREAASQTLQNLQLVKDGLLSTAQASQALQVLIARGFTLEQSVNLIKAFADNAAFGKSAGLSFADAVVSQAQGLKQLNNQLLDNGGATKNLSVILRERGFELEDVDSKTKGAAATLALYNGFLAESAANSGNAAKFANEFSGGQAKLEAASQKVLITIGEMITKNPALNDSFQELSKSLAIVNSILKDSDSELSQLVNAGTTTFAALVRGSAELLSSLEAILGVVRDFSAEITFGASNFIFDKLFPKTDPAQQKVLEGAKKFREEFDKALKGKPQGATGTTAPFKASEKDLEALKKFVKESEEKAKKFEESVSKAGEAILGLESKLQVNPLAAFYDQASARQKDFLEKFKDVPKELTERFKKANQDVLALDLFKGGLSQTSLLNNLILERDKLEAGLGGKSQLNEAQQARLAQLQKASLDTQLATAQKFAREATNPLQRNLANEQILAATSDISKLTPEQIDVRLKALNDSITFQQQLAKDNFDRLNAQTAATSDNTAALVQMGNKLSSVEGALANFKEGAIIKIVNESPDNARVDLGRV